MPQEVSTEVSQVVRGPITCHAWSADGTRLAVCPGDNTVKVFIKDVSGWALEATLEEHDQMVTAMDWHSGERGDRLLTVSADRNGYVWTRLASQSEWKPSLVLLRLRRAATCVRWSPDGLEFAVGGSEGIVSVGYYEAENDWWICKHLRLNFDASAILSVEWHPSSRLLAASTLAGRVEVLGASLHSSHAVSSVSPVRWIDDPALLGRNFDKGVASLEVGCWVHGMSFSPSGDVLALAAHDGHVHIVNFLANGAKQMISGSPMGLAVRRVLFLAEGAVVASGFGNASPFLLVKEPSSDVWKSEGPLQASSSGKSSSVASRGVSHGGGGGSTINSSPATSKAFGGALAKFRALDSHGLAAKKESPFHDDQGTGNTIKLPTKREIHRGSISDMRLLGRGQISSSGHDGTLVVWDVGLLMNRIGISLTSL